MGLFDDNDKVLREERVERIDEIILSTGNVDRKYIVRDLIFTSMTTNDNLFDETADIDQILKPLKQKMRMKVIDYGADAMINCHFDYQKNGEQTKIIAYGTVVQFMQATIGG